jgi:hypothetical protein
VNAELASDLIFAESVCMSEWVGVYGGF